MIYIVIPVHNRKNYTKNCLLSLRNQTYKDFKIVVINDGSSDDTEEMLKNEFQEVYVIEGDGNLWWTAATNLGVEYALENNADYVLTLNNDTEAESDFIENLLKYAEPNIIQGALWKKKDSNIIIDGGTSKINWITGNNEKILESLTVNHRKGLHKVTYYSARGLFIHKSVFEKIGLFDSKYFPHYAADIDFTMRAKKNGINVCVNYDAVLYIFLEESWSYKIKNSKSLCGYFSHLFSIKGGGNIKNFYRLSLRHCPKKYLILNLFIGISRRLIGYFIS